MLLKNYNPYNGDLLFDKGGRKMELEEKLKEEAITLANKLEDMTDKASDEYQTTLDRYQAVVRMLGEETKRINSTQALELEARKLELEKDKSDRDAMQKRYDATIEEEKLKQQKRSNWWQVGLKVLGGVVTVGANLASIYCMIRFNNSGETLTSWENKFIFPEKIK